MVTSVDVVQGLYERWCRGDLRALGAEIDPAVELIQDPLMPAAVLQGREGWERWASRWEAAYEDLEICPDALIPIDEANVLALVSLTGRPAGGGAPLSWAAAHLWTVRDGRVVRWQAHLDLDAARATLDA